LLFSRVVNFSLQGLIADCLKFPLPFFDKIGCSSTQLVQILYCADFYTNIALLICYNKKTGLQKQSKRVIDYANAIVRERYRFFLGKIV